MQRKQLPHPNPLLEKEREPYLRSYLLIAFSLVFVIVIVIVIGTTGCSPSSTGSITIQIDTTAQRHPISPLVYGMNYAGENLEALNCPIHRIGGNNMSRYNWRMNADNKAGDWFFESIGDKEPEPGGRVNRFVAANRKAHAQSMVTVPIIGWVAKIGAKRQRLWSYSVKKYGAQEKIEPEKYPDAGNGKRPDGTPITTNNPNDANVPTTAEYMRPWITNLTTRFGTAQNGGVGYYILDNEPSVWFDKHQDVAPVGIRMADLFGRMRDTATMIKSVDPTALVVGPEEWGWTGYLYSGYDSQWGKKNGYRNLPDRAAHNGVDQEAYLLKQFAESERLTGKRLLDVFSLHYYPQGGEFGGGVDIAMQQRRNRSTRSLWDPQYRDESWIRDTVRLIPRMKEWVAQNYPGTRIGLTEYNWGADEHINGATTQADILGILGREGVDVATRWTAPAPKTPTFKAVQMYRNYDGKKGTFGNTSVSCTAPDPDTISAFAAQKSDGTLTIMLVEKEAVGNRQIRLNLKGFEGGANTEVYQLTEANQIKQLPAVSVTENHLTLVLPAPSVTLLVLPPRSR